VEETLLVQYGAKTGDVIRLGQLETRIVGSLLKVPGETVAFATIAPRVYIPMSDLEKTGLIREGSLASYRIAWKFPASTNVPALVKSLQPRLDENRLAANTVEKRKEDMGRSMENLYHYLNLVGFIALLLGAVGVASAIHVHIRQKLESVAVLRCLGCSVGQTFAIYLVQAAALGGLGAVVGTALGLVIQSIVPRVVADFVPFQIEFHTSWMAVAEAAGIGFAICIAFALLPLLSIRRVAPLAAIRAEYESVETSSSGRRRWDLLPLGVLGLIAAGVVAFALTHTRKWQHGLGFAGGLGIAFLLLAGVAKGIAGAVRRWVRPGLPFVWRQGLTNLYRPQNRTVLLMLSLGLGTFMMLTAYLTRETLLGQIATARAENQANTVLFDIQPDQRDGVRSLLREQGLPWLEEAPIVTMRLNAVKGRTVEEMLADQLRPVPRWALRREYRSTFADALRSGEKLTAGVWHGTNTKHGAIIPVSVEEGIAKELHVKLGDELIWDIQGVPMTTKVASLREVDWKRVQPNFFVVFPRGVLEDAPLFHVATTRVPTPEASAALQRAVVQRFPNVSAIDLALILQTVDSLMTKVSFVVRFMGLFVLVTGFIVLTGAILTGRYQRVRESILLRTLGATRSQIVRVLLAEYVSLGVLAATTGIVLALGAGWALARFVWQAPMVVPLGALAFTVASVTALTVGIGWLTSRGVSTHPPLEILREA
jgi:putative ABC transport system permease protein